MDVKVLFFAQLAEAVGMRETSIPIDGETQNVQDVLDAVLERFSALEPWRDRVAVARNERYAKLSDLVAPDDVVALIPPVSGG